MDIRNGNIYSDEDAQKQMRAEKERERFLRQMNVPPTEKQLARNPARVGRNEPCPCGSGAKFKKCCLFK